MRKSRRRLGKATTYLAASFIAAATTFSTGCASLFIRTKPIPVFNPQSVIDQKNEDYVVDIINHFDNLLDDFGDQRVPAALIIFSGQVPGFLLSELKDPLKDGWLSRDELLGALISTGQKLPYDLNPGQEVIDEAAELLRGENYDDPDGSVARALANTAIYISVEHFDKISKHVRPPANMLDDDDKDIFDPGPVIVPDEMHEGHYSIAVIGDSLAAGTVTSVKGESFVPPLRNALLEKGWDVDIENRSLAGASTGFGLREAKRLVESDGEKPDLVVLSLGGNDVLQQIDPAIVRENLRQTIELLKSHDIDVVLIGMRSMPWMDEEYTKEFDAIYAGPGSLSEEFNLVVDPFVFESLIINQNGKNLTETFNQNLMADFIHPNKEGAYEIAKDIADEIDEGLKRIKDAREQSKSSDMQITKRDHNQPKQG